MKSPRIAGRRVSILQKQPFKALGAISPTGTQDFYHWSTKSIAKSLTMRQRLNSDGIYYHSKSHEMKGVNTRRTLSPDILIRDIKKAHKEASTFKKKGKKEVQQNQEEPKIKPKQPKKDDVNKYFTTLPFCSLSHIEDDPNSLEEESIKERDSSDSENYSESEDGKKPLQKVFNYSDSDSVSDTYSPQNMVSLAKIPQIMALANIESPSQSTSFNTRRFTLYDAMPFTYEASKPHTLKQQTTRFSQGSRATQNIRVNPHRFSVADLIPSHKIKSEKTIPISPRNVPDVTSSYNKKSLCQNKQFSRRFTLALNSEFKERLSNYKPQFNSKKRKSLFKPKKQGIIQKQSSEFTSPNKDLEVIEDGQISTHETVEFQESPDVRQKRGAVVFQTSPSTHRTKRTQLEATFARAVKGAQRKIIKMQSESALKLITFRERMNQELKRGTKPYSSKEPKTERQKLEEEYQSCLNRIYWHRSRNDQAVEERKKKQTFVSKEFNFKIHLNKNLIYAQSGSKQTIKQPLYLASKTCRFDPFQIQKRRDFLKNQELSMKQESILFKARKNDFLFLLKNEKKLSDEQLNQVDERGCTPLHLAVKYGHKEFVQVLLRMKVPVNVQDKLGNTPLHYAFMNSNVELINLLLLSQKTKHQVFNNEMNTPVQYASKELLAQNFPFLKRAVGSKELVPLPLHIAGRKPSLLGNPLRDFGPLYETKKSGETTQGGILQTYDQRE